MKRHHRDTETEITEETFLGGSQRNLCVLGVLRVSVVNPIWK